MTSTEMSAVTEYDTLFPPAIIHRRHTHTAVRMTAGTNTADTRSAILAIGALVPCAPSIIPMIWYSAVSLPTRSARNLRLPVPLTVAPKTLSPAFFSTGTDSPVSIDSSTLDSPSRTVPSAGTDSPGLTSTVSPALRSSRGMTSSFPSFITVAFWGSRLMSPDTASLVFTFPTASRYFPIDMKAMIIPAESNVRSSTAPVSPVHMSQVL
ncbi:hypothetical protein AUQ37_06870 [Candidatus Methanomethylophilus sp. 1R26]|nr:hypothetical protein AUQ37_06870 [Candidatus Methanomethylophilus sp. 1R26]